MGSSPYSECRDAEKCLFYLQKNHETLKLLKNDTSCHALLQAPTQTNYSRFFHSQGIPVNQGHRVISLCKEIDQLNLTFSLFCGSQTTNRLYKNCGVIFTKTINPLFILLYHSLKPTLNHMKSSSFPPICHYKDLFKCH